MTRRGIEEANTHHHDFEYFYERNWWDSLQIISHRVVAYVVLEGPEEFTVEIWPSELEQEHLNWWGQASNHDYGLGGLITNWIWWIW